MTRNVLALRCALLVSAAALALSACGGGGSSGAPGTALAPNPPSNNGPASALGSGPFKQLDRLNRPAVNEVFATFAQHQQNNVDTPNEDAANLGPQIVSFTENVGGRSAAIANVLRSVLTPDVQIVDLNGTSLSCIGMAPGTCNNYLGVETGGATQAPKGLRPFGGRALTDDVVDISLGAIFGKTVPTLGLAPDDGKESDGRADASYSSGHRPDLVSDHVSWQTAPKHFTRTFPYFGAPQ
ncbi:MAG TPA: DUF4331 family protein [Candidatus Baltobacteraceae bacterium]|nr:DUF4331 family protein [Candidatus Baltobacteraceae bacterium]